MAENKMLEATDVRKSKSTNNKTTVLIIAKDAEGNTYTIPFLFKSHYTEGIQKTFSRLSPIKIKTAGDEVKEEVKAEVKEEDKNG